MHFYHLNHYQTTVLYQTSQDRMLINEFKGGNRGRLVIQNKTDKHSIFYDDRLSNVWIYSRE